MFEQIILSMAGIAFAAGGFVLACPGLFARSAETLTACWTLYFLCCACGACAAAIQVTRHKILELIQAEE